MQEVEKEVEFKEGKKVILTKPRNSIKESYKTVFDIHSLRVSGITNLIEAGVPIEIVSQFVAGHASTVMTLYYNKNTVEEISTTIEKLHNNKKVSLKEDLESLETQSEFEEKLIMPLQEHQEGLYKIYRDNKEYWNIGLSGICPVSCEEVGREDKCCPRCQYWITGTPFIVGQTTELNDLMYKIRKKANKIKDLNLKYIIENSSQIKGEIELLNDSISMLISEWSIRYKYIEKSIDMLNNSKSKKQDDNIQLVSSGDKINLGIENTNDFGLAYHICNTSTLIDEFDNSEAQFELEFFINKILSNSSIAPFMYRLSREESLKANTQFAQHLLSVYNETQIEELIEGQLTLEHNEVNELANIIGIKNQIKIRN